MSSSRCVMGMQTKQGEADVWEALNRNLRDHLAGGVSRTVLFLGIERAIRLALGAVVLGMVARYLGPAEFGLLSQALAVSILWCSNAGLGSERIIVQWLMEQPEAGGRFLGAAAALRFLGATILGGAAILTMKAMEGNPRLVQLTLVACLAWSLRAFDVIDLGFQARAMAWRSVSPRLMAFGAGAFLQIWLATRGVGSDGLVWAGVLEAALSAILLRRAWIQLEATPWRVLTKDLRSLLGLSWPILLAGIIAQAYQRLDVVCVGRWCGAADAGIYAAAGRLGDIAWVPGGILQVALLPKVIAWASGDEREGRSRFVRLSIAGWVAGALVTLPFILAAPWLVNRIFGESFGGGAVYLRIRMAGILVMYGAFLRAAWMTVQGQQLLLMATSCIGFALNLGLDLILVPRHGAIAAAWIWTATQFITLVLANILFRSTRWMAAGILPFPIPHYSCPQGR